MKSSIRDKICDLYCELDFQYPNLSVKELKGLVAVKLNTRISEVEKALGVTKNEEY